MCAIAFSEWWGAGVVICLERDADLHVAQLMPLPLTVPCFSKIQIGFTFLVPAHPGSSGQRVVCMCACYNQIFVVCMYACCRGRITYYTEPPETYTHSPHVSAEIVTEMTRAFDIDALLGDEQKILEGINK